MSLHILLAVGFLFLKTGEKFATQDSAGPTVALLTEAVGAKLGEKLEPQVFNDPTKAIEYITRRKPAVGIVTPGFYLTYAKALAMEPVLEVKRQNVAVERYVLAVKAKPGAVVATTLAGEPNYVLAVILQGKYGDEVRLQATTDVEGAVFDMVEGAKAAATGVLMEEGTWKVISADPELGQQVKAAFTSDDLPGNLVVVFRRNAGSLDSAKLKSVLKDLTGQEVLNQIRVEAFTEIDEARLKKAQERFYAK